LISGAAALGACFLPADILRRARQYQLDNNEVLIEAPESYRRTLYATPQDSGTWQFALVARTTEAPRIPSWRDWLENYQGINVDDRNDLAQWVRENRDYHRLGRKSSDWLDSELCDRTWCNYIDGQYAYQDSPEAQALDYLFRLNEWLRPVCDRNQGQHHHEWIQRNLERPNPRHQHRRLLRVALIRGRLNRPGHEKTVNLFLLGNSRSPRHCSRPQFAGFTIDFAGGRKWEREFIHQPRHG
jgi:hypothetical protein